MSSSEANAFSGLVGFYSSLLNSPKFSVRFLARLAEKDMRTVLGSTLSYILQQCDLSSDSLGILSPSMVKKSCSYMSTPADQEWRNYLLGSVQQLHQWVILNSPP